jgi:hypothetical protein
MFHIGQHQSTAAGGSRPWFVKAAVGVLVGYLWRSTGNICRSFQVIRAVGQGPMLVPETHSPSGWERRLAHVAV